MDNSVIDKYEDTRNYPALDSTSRIGVNLRFGTVSTRAIVKKSSTRSNNTYLKELIWREFFIQILLHFPHTTKKSFKDKYERIEWRNDMDDFKSWCDGKTGYPIVDAGMNQLNKTGFMHNRLRMSKQATRPFMVRRTGSPPSIVRKGVTSTHRPKRGSGMIESWSNNPISYQT